MTRNQAEPFMDHFLGEGRRERSSGSTRNRERPYHQTELPEAWPLVFPSLSAFPPEYKMSSFCQEPLASAAFWPHPLDLASLQTCSGLRSLLLQAQWNSPAPPLQLPFLPCGISSALVIRSQSRLP